MSNTSELTKLRHTAAHVLALAVTSTFKGVKLGSCGTTPNGFYYDFEFKDSFGADELEKLDMKMRELIAQGLDISTVYKSLDEVKELFSETKQPFKHELISDINQKKVDVVVLGDSAHIDLCIHPVSKSLSELKYFGLEEVSGAYWKGDEKNKMLTRISGACFLTEQELESYREYKLEVYRRDHRLLGKKLGFFTFAPEIGQGLVVWKSRGTYVRNMIASHVKKYFKHAGVQIVETPILTKNVESVPLVQPLGEQIIAKHAQEESSDVFLVRQQMLDGHLEIFSSEEMSYRDLPWKVGEIGKVLRFERSGMLEGLHRVREITQDNITVVCAREHIESQMDVLLSSARGFLKDLGFANYAILVRYPVADTKVQKQENVFLASALSSIGRKQGFSVQIEGESEDTVDPEIVLSITDSLNQVWELSKIQVISSVPIARGITYTGKDGEQHIPYVLRATITGSFERLVAVLLEHYAGVLPLWLTFEQARVLSVTSKQEMYAERVMRTLLDGGIRTTIDASPDTLEAKIKQAEEEKVPYMLVVGEKEANTASVSVRVQRRGDVGLIDLDTFVKTVQHELSLKSIKSQFA